MMDTVVQICMVDESQQYDCISQAAQTAQRTHSSGDRVRISYNPSATFEEDYTETSFHSSDDSN